MGASKIVDEQELLRWFDEGKTYKEMVDIYAEKYNLDVGHSMFGNFRKRRGLDRRILRDDELIPWQVKPEHRYRYTAVMLRALARVRADKNVTEKIGKNLDSWLAGLNQDGAVIHYDPDTEQGWFRIPREARDVDVVRQPLRKTTLQPNTDAR